MYSTHIFRSGNYYQQCDSQYYIYLKVEIKLKIKNSPFRERISRAQQENCNNGSVPKKGKITSQEGMNFNSYFMIKNEVKTQFSSMRHGIVSIIIKFAQRKGVRGFHFIAFYHLRKLDKIAGTDLIHDFVSIVGMIKMLYSLSWLFVAQL